MASPNELPSSLPELIAHLNLLLSSPEETELDARLVETATAQLLGLPPLVSSVPIPC